MILDSGDSLRDKLNDYIKVLRSYNQGSNVSGCCFYYFKGVCRGQGVIFPTYFVPLYPVAFRSKPIRDWRRTDVNAIPAQEARRLALRLA